MAVDPKIRDAIKTVVTESGQSEGLARKLESWFEAIATGTEDINEKKSAHRRLELIYDAVQLDDSVVESDEEEASQ